MQGINVVNFVNAMDVKTAEVCSILIDLFIV